VTERPLLLVVEDDEVLRTRLVRAFEQRGLDVRSAATVGEAERLIADEAPELALVDLRVGDRHGLDLIPVLREADPATRIVVLTGYGSVATALEAVRRGAVHYLTKPAHADEILAAFDRLNVEANRDAASERSDVRELQPMSLDRVEWEHINRVLVDCAGNISEAARVLGLHRRSLQRKLAKFPSRR
jgi:two-component system, response regulator RegA